MNGGLDPRAWLTWGIAASLPAMLGRNPYPLFATLIIVAGVRLTWPVASSGPVSFTTIIRLAVVLGAVSMLFNALTVRAGDRVLVTIPASVPLIDGPITANALLFGFLSALAALCLVTVWITVAENMDWLVALRLAPDRVLSLSVAASVAVSFVPMTIVSFREIREAQALRGHSFRGLRDLAPIAGPVLNGSLERATEMAEALESRGFGGMHRETGERRHLLQMLWVLMVACAIIAIFSFTSGREIAALVLASIGGVILFGVRHFSRKIPVMRTRYRSPNWTMRDTVVVSGSGLTVAGIVVALQFAPEALRYEPYPTMSVPGVSLTALIAMLGLIGPVLVAPASSSGEQNT